MKIFLATYDSRHFEFMGVGDSAARAIDVCAQGMRQHADQCGISRDWWWRDLSCCSEREALKADSGLWSVREVELGNAYRDGSLMPLPSED